MDNLVFEVAPAYSKGFWISQALILLVLVPIFALMLYTVYSARNMTFAVSTEGLRIRHAPYGRFIPADVMMTDGARIIDADGAGPLRPGVRTNGIGLPGYSVGWFRLNNGEKALMFVTSKQDVVYIPTKNGYAVMLSTTEPHAMLRALQSR